MPHNCNVRSFTDNETGEIRAICTCGWSYRSPRPSDSAGWKEFKHAVAHHRPPLTKEPPLKAAGFVSGLPDA